MKKFITSLPALIIIALIIGGFVGYSISGDLTSPVLGVAIWLKTAFLNLLKMVIAPLIFASIVSGVAGIGSSGSLGRIAGKTLLLIFSTTFIAIIIGLVLVNFIKPGSGVDLQVGAMSATAIDDLVSKQQSLPEILLNVIPSNVAASFVSANMLQIIVFAILFGVFTTKLNDKMQSMMLDFFKAIFEVMMKMTVAIISLTPIGIFGIAVEQVATNNNIGAMISSLGWLILTVMSGILIQFFVVLPLIMKSRGIKPYAYMRKMTLPLITAFTTASSTAALPLSMNAASKEVGISDKIVGFCFPIGATINMNGTALFECVSVIFLAQAYGIDMSIQQQIIIVATSLLAAVGSAGIPMAGLVMMTVILTAVGLPLEGIGMILSVNFILDMARTATNVWGDCSVAAIVAKSEGEKLSL